MLKRTENRKSWCFLIIGMYYMSFPFLSKRNDFDSVENFFVRNFLKSEIKTHLYLSETKRTIIGVGVWPSASNVCIGSTLTDVEVSFDCFLYYYRSGASENSVFFLSERTV